MLALKDVFLSVLLLTVASRVKGDSTTVTLFNVALPTQTLSLIGISAISVEENGGTAYVGGNEFTITSSGSPVATTQTLTVVEAASWEFISIQATNSIFTESFQENCTIGADGVTGECVEIIAAVGPGPVSTPQTITFSGQVVPLATLTVTGPTTTSSSAATIVDNPIFNKLPIFFGGIFVIMMFF